jgi:hypothetical protein
VVTGLERNPGARLRRTLGAAPRNPHAVEHDVQIGAVELDFEGRCLPSVVRTIAHSGTRSASSSCFSRPKGCHTVPRRGAAGCDREGGCDASYGSCGSGALLPLDCQLVSVPLW